jgi:hypothetical protein
LLRRNKPELGMIEDVERRQGQEANDPHIGGWRIVFSAWALVLILVILLAAAEVMTCRRSGAHKDGRLTGAVIPRHDTACGGSGIPSAPGHDGCENLPVFDDRSAY